MTRFVALATFAFATHAVEPLPAGKAQTTLQLGGKPIEVFSYRPAKFSDGPLLVVMHGIQRNADDYRDHAIVLAEKFGMLVVAPRFDLKRFSTDAYQRGGVMKGDTVQPREAWTYSFIPKLVAEVRAREGRADMPYYLIGHSAGGQFLARMTGFLPGEPVRIVAANPGAHLFPTREMEFPYGFGGLPDELSNGDVIRRYLAAPLTLYLGTADTGSYHLDVKPGAMKQGATRIERGRACFRFAQELARENGWPFNWRLVEAEGVDHDATKMFAHAQAAIALFGAREARADSANVWRPK